MNNRKGFTQMPRSKADWPPEDLLILAVYIRARNDLFGRSRKWREDAELFFEADGLDPKRIRAWYVEAQQPGGLVTSCV